MQGWCRNVPRDGKIKCVKCNAKAHLVFDDGEGVCWRCRSLHEISRPIPWQHVDPFIRPLVGAMKRAGCHPTYSCQGGGPRHSEDEKPYVLFAPGDYRTIRKLRASLQETPWRLLNRCHTRHPAVDAYSYTSQRRRLDKYAVELPDTMEFGDKVQWIGWLTAWFELQAQGWTK